MSADREAHAEPAVEAAPEPETPSKVRRLLQHLAGWIRWIMGRCCAWGAWR